MAKVYSKSQGGFVELPNEVIPPGGGDDRMAAGPFPAGSMGGGQGQGGMNPDILKALFLSAMLQQPKQATALKSIFDFMSPQQSEGQRKEEGEKKNQIQEMNQALADIQAIRAKIRKGGKSTTGGTAGFNPFGVREKFPTGSMLGLSPEVAELNPLISNFNTRLFEIAGKAFTGPERGLLRGIIVGADQDASVIEPKLAQAEEKIKQKMQQFQSGAPYRSLVPDPDERPSLSSFEDGEADDFEE